jgi:hypothetical protein
VLTFTLIFAVLQKTKLLGDGKKQIDSLVGLVVGLLLISFPLSRNIVSGLMPFLAVAIAILFIFMLFYGLAYGKTEMESSIKWIFVILFSISLIAVFLYVSGFIDPLYNFLFNRQDSSQVWINLVLVVVIIGAIIAVLKGEGKKSDK